MVYVMRIVVMMVIAMNLGPLHQVHDDWMNFCVGVQGWSRLVLQNELLELRGAGARYSGGAQPEKYAPSACERNMVVSFFGGQTPQFTKD